MLTSLNKHLSKLEKNLASIETFRNKGCPVDSSLGEIYLDLKNVGVYLQEAQSQDNEKTNQELAKTTERYRNLLAKFESIADDVNVQDQGMVISSNNTLPEFFVRITSRYQDWWKKFERITTLFGIGMIVLTIVGPTYYLAVGNIPLMQYIELEMSGVSALVFILGLILALVVHEFAHGIILANNGIKIMRVGAMAGSMVGGFVEAEETTFFQSEPVVRLRFNATGLGTNALLALILLVIGIASSSQLFLLLALSNLFFGFINSFPISPLDGGWVYEDMIKLYLTNPQVKRFLLNLPLGIFVLWIILFIRFALL